jgi:hypothetical protein
LSYLKQIAVAAISTVMLGLVASPAMAQTKPGFEQFEGCLNVPEVVSCMRSETSGGHIQIGKTDTPINKTIVLSGGLADGNVLFNSKGGLIAPPLNVPGGLTGLTGWSEFFVNLFTFGANKVEAQAILVGTPSLTLTGDPDTVQVNLPIRVKLINPFLVSTCSIGSAGSPINLKLTTGTTAPPLPNKPISGVLNPFGFAPPGILQTTGNTLVDNSFSAPAASGCDLLGFGLINGVVNSRVGLPSAAGKNTAAFSSTTLKLVGKESVY